MRHGWESNYIVKKLYGNQSNLDGISRLVGRLVVRIVVEIVVKIILLSKLHHLAIVKF